GVVLAVEEPGVDVVAHVDDVDAVVGGIGQGVHAGLEEEHPGVLTRAEVDEGDPGGDAGDAQVVDGRGDGAGDVGAVAVVVDVGGVFAVGGLARSVELLAIGVFGDVGDEVAAETAVEVGGDVGVVAVDAGVDDADQDAFVARLLLVGPVGGGADHAHVPLKVGEGFGAGGAAGGGVVQGVLVDGRSGGAVAGGGGGADLAVGGGADDGV